MESLQDKYSPNGVCFGCGPANPEGLHLKSRPDGEFVVADYAPRPNQTGYEGYVNGGIISVILDCHGNMTAAYSLMKELGLAAPPGTVTAELSVKFLKPTPMGPKLLLKAKATKIEGRRVTVQGSLQAGDLETVIMQGLYVSVKSEHPGFEKWH